MAIAFDSKATFFQVINHGRDEGVGIRLALPEIKAYAQCLEIAFHPGDGYGDKMVPEGAISGAAILQFQRGAAGAFQPCGVFLAGV